MKTFRKLALVSFALGAFASTVHAVDTNVVLGQVRKGIDIAVQYAPQIRDAVAKVPFNDAAKMANPYIPDDARTNVCKPVCFFGRTLTGLPQNVKEAAGTICAKKCKDTGNPKAAEALGLTE